MKNNEKGYGTVGMMILAVIIIFSVVGIVIIGFKVIKKNDDAKLMAASDTEYMDKQNEREDGRDSREEDTEDMMQSSGQEKSDSQTEEQKESDTESDTEANSDADKKEEEDSDKEVSESDEKVYLIRGSAKSSNRYEKADHLSYTTVTKYTTQDLSLLDSYGLKITRNEIFARHGRMFNDQELQEYFQRQQWYVPQVAANDFDTSCLNEVEKYNVELISTYEQQLGG